MKKKHSMGQYYNVVQYYYYINIDTPRLRQCFLMTMIVRNKLIL